MSSKGPFDMDEDELDDLYNWVDKFNLSRPKRNLARDFSDGLLVGEIINQRFPGMVELHNCVQSSNVQTKKSNWDTLNSTRFVVNKKERFLDEWDSRFLEKTFLK